MEFLPLCLTALMLRMRYGKLREVGEVDVDDLGERRRPSRLGDDDHVFGGELGDGGHFPDASFMRQDLFAREVR